MEKWNKQIGAVENGMERLQKENKSVEQSTQ